MSTGSLVLLWACASTGLADFVRTGATHVGAPPSLWAKLTSTTVCAGRTRTHLDFKQVHTALDAVEDRLHDQSPNVAEERVRGSLG